MISRGPPSNRHYMTLTVVDEIQSLVVEIGSQTTRAGYSGDDCPQAVFQTLCASNGTMGLSAPSLDYVAPVTATGRSASAEALQCCLAAAFERLRVDPKEYPLLLVDTPLDHDSPDNVAARQTLCELAFEQFGVPALYFGKSAVMSMFAMGRHTGLVLESGASSTSIVPVYEGIPLNSGITQSPIAGDYLDRQADLLLQQSCSADYEHLLIPHAKLGNRKAVGLGESPQYDVRQNVAVSDSYAHHAKRAILRDFKESIVQVAESASVSEKDLGLRPPRYYEFPCGFNKNFGAERFRLGECLFSGDEQGNHGVIDLIKESLNKLNEKMDSGSINPQYQHHLTSCLVVSGGTTLSSGFMERLNMDLQTKLPLLGKMKVQAASSAMERKLSPWLGGSILASLGTMQAFWMTRQEYSDQGPSILSKKFP